MKKKQLKKKNNKSIGSLFCNKYIIAYIVCYVLVIANVIITLTRYNIFKELTIETLLTVLGIVLPLLAISTYITKKEINNENIIFPITFILFIIVMTVIKYYYIGLLPYNNLHFHYLNNIIYFIYVFLNIYTYMSFKKSK